MLWQQTGNVEKLAIQNGILNANANVVTTQLNLKLTPVELFAAIVLMESY